MRYIKGDRVRSTGFWFPHVDAGTVGKVIEVAPDGWVNVEFAEGLTYWTRNAAREIELAVVQELNEIGAEG